MGSFIPSPYTVVHIPRQISDDIDDDTGNPITVDSSPIVRKAQGFSQIGRIRGSSKQLFGPEFVKRVETEIHMSVDDPNVYATNDQVRIFPELDDAGDYIPGTGFAFAVDGLPVDSAQGPFPLLFKSFGGLVRLRRVT